MKKMIKNISIVTLIILLVSLSIIACQPTEKPEDNNGDSYNDQNMNNNEDMNNEDMNNEDTGMGNENMNGNQMDNKSEMIADKLVEMQGVDDATVVISGNTAMVGVDISGTMEGNMTDKVKNDIKSKVRETDSNIKQVMVSASPDIFNRLDNIAQKINQGDAIEGFRDEINEIMKRMTPNGTAQ